MKMTLFIEDMTCGGCVKRITKAVQNLDPTISIETNVDEHLAHFTFPEYLNPEKISDVIEKVGYTPKPH